MTQDSSTDIPADTPIHTDTLAYGAGADEATADTQATEEEPEMEELAEEDWLDDEPYEEMPRRPRRKLLGAGGSPIALALFVILLLAGAFFAGVEVEKGQTSSSASGGLPSGFAALRGRLGTGGTSSSGSSTTGSSGAGFPSGGGFPGASGLAGGGIATGEVSFANGNTLYVTSSEGNTVKVSAPRGIKVSKTVTTGVNAIHPGDTVIVRGTQNKNGGVSASSITISSSGGSGTSATGGSSTGGGGGAGSSTPQLFGAG